MKRCIRALFSVGTMLAFSARGMETDLKIEITETNKNQSGMFVCTVDAKDLKRGFERASKGMSFSFQASDSVYTFKDWQIAYMQRLIENNKISAQSLTKSCGYLPQCYMMNRDIYVRFFEDKSADSLTSVGLDERKEFVFRLYGKTITLLTWTIRNSPLPKVVKAEEVKEDMARAYLAQNVAPAPVSPIVANSTPAKAPTNVPSFSLFKAINRPIKSALVTAGAYALLNQSPYMYSFEPAISFCASIPVWHWAYKQYRAAREARTYSAALIHGASSMACGLLGALLIGRQVHALSFEQ